MYGFCTDSHVRFSNFSYIITFNFALFFLRFPELIFEFSLIFFQLSPSIFLSFSSNFPIFFQFSRSPVVPPFEIALQKNNNSPHHFAGREIRKPEPDYWVTLVAVASSETECFWPIRLLAGRWKSRLRRPELDDLRRHTCGENPKSY